MSELYVLELVGFKGKEEANGFLDNVLESAKFGSNQGVSVINLSNKGKKLVKDVLVKKDTDTDEKESPINFASAIYTLESKREKVMERLIDIEDGMYEDKADSFNIERLRCRLIDDEKSLKGAIDVLRQLQK